MTQIKIRPFDQDSRGNVHHLQIIEWIAHARVEFIDGMIKKSGVKGIDYVLLNLNVDFLQESTDPGAVNIISEVVEVNGKSLTTRYEVLKGDFPIAKADCINVFFDTETKKTIPIPEELRSILDE